MIRDLGLRSVLSLPFSRAATLSASLHCDSGVRKGLHEDRFGCGRGAGTRAATAVDNARLFKESKQAQESLRHSNLELRRVNEDLNQFAYSASHHLQEPLRMIAVFSQMLGRKYQAQLDTRAHKYINFMVEGAKRMEVLLKDLLAYTQSVNFFAPQQMALLDTNAVA